MDNRRGLEADDSTFVFAINSFNMMNYSGSDCWEHDQNLLIMFNCLNKFLY